MSEFSDRVAEKLKKLFTFSVEKGEEGVNSMKKMIAQSTDLLGYPVVENEELTWNGNREEMEQKKAEKEGNGDGTIGRTLEIDIIKTKRS